VNTKIILSAADRLGINAEKLPGRFVKLTYKEQVSYCQGSDFEFENLIAARICGNKQLTSTILADNGFPVPEFATFSYKDYPSALDFFQRLPKPVVVKPQLSTAHSRGVTTGIITLRDFERAFALAAVYRRRVIVERFVTGQSYRILLLDGKVLSVVKRSPPHVVGDGQSTVRQLITKNEANSAVMWDKAIDVDLQHHLRSNQVNLDDIPKHDQLICLKNTATYNGWPNQIQEVTDKTHSDFIQCAKKINEVIRAKFCAIDIFTTDISKPISQVGYTVNEVNTTPALNIAYEPIAANEFPDKVGIIILEYLFGIQ
jgi:cyanophycin synthetase